MQLDDLAAARCLGDLGPVAGARYAHLLDIEEALMACADDGSPAGEEPSAAAGDGPSAWAPPTARTVIVVDADVMASDVIGMVLRSVPHAHVVSVAAPQLDATLRTGEAPGAHDFAAA